MSQSDGRHGWHSICSWEHSGRWSTSSQIIEESFSPCRPSPLGVPGNVVSPAQGLGGGGRTAPGGTSAGSRSADPDGPRIPSSRDHRTTVRGGRAPAPFMTGHDGEPVSLRLAVLPSLASGVLPGAIRAWRDAHPDAEVSMLEFLDGDRLPREMLRGVADLAVGPVPDGWPGEVYPLYPGGTGGGAPRRRHVCRRHRYPPGPRAAGGSGLGPALREQPVHASVMQACARAGFTPRAAVLRPPPGRRGWARRRRAGAGTGSPRVRER